MIALFPRKLQREHNPHAAKRPPLTTTKHQPAQPKTPLMVVRFGMCAGHRTRNQPRVHELCGGDVWTSNGGVIGVTEQSGKVPHQYLATSRILQR